MGKGKKPKRLKCGNWPRGAYHVDLRKIKEVVKCQDCGWACERAANDSGHYLISCPVCRGPRYAMGHDWYAA